MRLFRFDDPVHVEASSLLAWYANGTLEATEQARVDRHIRECAACSREVEELRRLQTLLRGEEAERRTAVSRQRARALLDHEERSSLRAGRPARKWRALPGWALAALVLQSVLLVLLTVVLFARPPAEPLYHALGGRPAASAGADAVVVVFDAERPQHEMRALLQALSARIVDGPDAAGAYTLQISPERHSEALSVLRSHRGVLLAEPASAAIRQR
jgi:anti-sigma factor RsiW